MTYDLLSWQLECGDTDDISINHILNVDTKAIAYADSDGVSFDCLSHYSFIFTMHVSDNNNVYRHECIDSVQIEFNTKSNLIST